MHVTRLPNKVVAMSHDYQIRYWPCALTSNSENSGLSSVASSKSWVVNNTLVQSCFLPAESGERVGGDQGRGGGGASLGESGI